MGWNLELACVPSTKGVAVNQIVPDIFAPTGTEVGFEDATSVSRGTGISAALVGEWIILIDVKCRLSRAGPWLSEVSAKRDLYIIRIADSPRELHYNAGKKQCDNNGIAA